MSKRNQHIYSDRLPGHPRDKVFNFKTTQDETDEIVCASVLAGYRNPSEYARDLVLSRSRLVIKKFDGDSKS